MDLSFGRFERDAAAAALPSGLAVLLAAAAGRQAASVTARLQARLVQSPAARGAFDAATAAVLTRWLCR